MLATNYCLMYLTTFWELALLVFRRLVVFILADFLLLGQTLHWPRNGCCCYCYSNNVEDKKGLRTLIRIMKPNQLRTGKEPLSKTSGTLNVPHIMDDIKHNISTMSQPLSQTFKEPSGSKMLYVCNKKRIGNISQKLEEITLLNFIMTQWKTELILSKSSNFPLLIMYSILIIKEVI